MDKKIEDFREEIVNRYKVAGIDIQKDESFVYENEDYWNALHELREFGGHDYSRLKKVLESCNRPTLEQIQTYKDSPDEKITEINYFYHDDKTFGLGEIYPMSIPKYLGLLGLINEYETKEKKHVHKGTLYYFLMEKFFEENKIDLGLLFVNKAFIEDDLNHTNIDVSKFPDTPAYKFLVLNRENPNQALLQRVNEVVKFMENEFLNDFGYNFDDFWNNFLNEASKKPNFAEAHQWFDHVIFFNSFIVRLRKIYQHYKITWDLFDSIFGEIMLSNIIGDLCLLIESFSKYKLNRPGETINRFFPELKTLYGWESHTYNTDDFKGANLEPTLNDIFNNAYHSQNDPIQNSFYLTWGLRNNFHHNIESMTIIKKNFKPIIKKQLHFFLDFAINR